MRRWPVALFLLAASLVSVRGQSPSLRWEPLQTGVTARLRGVSALSADVAWVSGERGTVLRTTDGGRTWQHRPIPGADGLDFRDIEVLDARTVLAMSAGPGDASRIYGTTDGGATWTRRFTASDAAMFLDALALRDARRGVAISDAVNGQFVILTTTDAGQTWARVPADRLPPALPNEGAFASSGTNIATQADHIWIGTTASRVLHSPDGGRTWSVVQTPVPTGQAAGIFSIAFRDVRRGVVVGGVYTKESEAVDNAATTADGGATWQVVRGSGLSGYRSVVTPLRSFGPGGWLAVGPTGSDVSTDDGRTWKPSGGEGYDAVSMTADGRIGFASGSRGRVARVVAVP